MRIQAPGIIRNLGYDSYIIGTSMLENTSANNASNILGGNFANISLSGSDYYERSYVLKLALKHKVKNIIYSMDDYYLTQRKGDQRYPFDAYSHLYENDPIEKVKFYLQFKYLKCLLVWSEKSGCIGDKKSLDRPNSWMHDKSHYLRFGGLDKWFSANNNDQIRKAFKRIVSASTKVRNGEYEQFDDKKLNVTIKNAIQYIDNNVILFARLHPDTQFYLIFPPYSRIRYAIWHQLEGMKAKVHEAVLSYSASIAEEMNNVSVYAYEDQGFLDDIANYKDTGHYSQWVNDMMTENIAKHRGELTEKNITHYLDVARKKALAYDLTGLGLKIDNYLKTENIN